MAIAQNIIIDQDADYLQQFTAKPAAGVVVDLTGATITAQVRKTFGASSATSFTPAKVAPHTAGIFTLALTDGQTALLERGRHVYDVVIADSGGDKTRVQSGVATVSPSVTRS